MKSTIKTQTGQVMCQPVGENGMLVATSSGLNLHSATIATPEQIAAFIFGLEQCLENLEARRDRATEYAKRYNHVKKATVAA